MGKHSKTFAINSQHSKFDMVVVDVNAGKISIKGKKLFFTLGKEEIMEVRIFESSTSAYNQVHYYLKNKLASAYYAAEILTWIDAISNFFSHSTRVYNI